MDKAKKFGAPAGRIPLDERVDPDPVKLLSINRNGEPASGGQRVFQLTQDALDAFRALRASSLAAGFDKELFTLTSAYRSSVRQAQLATAARAQYGAGAGKWVAQTRSEHITGRAFDLNLGLDNTSANAKAQLFAHTKAFQWLKANASDLWPEPILRGTVALVVQRQALSRRIPAGVSFTTVMALLFAGCGHSSASELPAASTTTVDGARGAAKRSLRSTPPLVAQHWLNALRDQDHESLVMRTALPFYFQSTSKVPRCDASAATPAELRKIAECIVSDAPLSEELKHANELHVSQLSRDLVPHWAARIVSESNRDRTPVKAFINGDGVTYVFVLLVTGDYVETCVEHAEFEQD